jgi:hypothetical protein
VITRYEAMVEAVGDYFDGRSGPAEGVVAAGKTARARDQRRARMKLRTAK